MQILLLSLNKADQVFFEAVSKNMKAEFKLVADPAQLCIELQNNPTSLVIVDGSTKEIYGDFEKILTDTIGLFSDVINPNHFFMVAACELHEAVHFLQSEICGNFMHRSFSEAEIDRVARLFTQALSDKAFGVEKYFSPETKTQSLIVKNSTQKNAIAESLKNHLLKLGYKSRMAALIATALDELIMNAVFDAPVNELGKAIYSQTPRNTEIVLDQKNQVEVKISFDGKLLGLSVSDQHGSLNKKKLLGQHLAKSYEKKDYESRTFAGAGAGLGLSHVFRNCGGIVFSCDTGARTEVMLFYKKTNSFVDFKDQFRFLATFMYFS